MVRYSFVIDTNAYTGNFEREMAAYMTGEIGDCEVGDTFAEMFRDDQIDVNFGEVILQVADEHGCYRPCAIEVTPGYVNNGTGKQVREDSEEAKTFKHKWPAYQSVAIFFGEDPTKYADLLKQRADEFVEIYNTRGGRCGPPKEKISIIGFRILATKTVVTVEEQIL